MKLIFPLNIDRATDCFCFFYHWPKWGASITLATIHTQGNTIYSLLKWISVTESGISVSAHQTIFKILYSLNTMRTRLFSNCISAWWVKCFNDFILLLSHSVHNKSEPMPEQHLFWFTKSRSLNSRRDAYMRYLEQNLPLGLCFVWGIS